MKDSRSNESGFGVGELLIVLVIVVVLVTAGWYVYRHNHSSSTKTTAQTSSGQIVNPYAGWKTYCILSACYQYPSNWNAVAGFPGDFDNSTDTAYVSLEPGTSKDSAEDASYIVSVESLPNSTTPLDIVGSVVNDKPIYQVYSASYISANNVKPGTTQVIVDGNYFFEIPNGTLSLVGTPGANGYAAITSFDQAKAWFSTSEAKADLLVLKSLYFQSSTTNPYVGWKTYCDTMHGDCFQYPANWVLGTNDTSGVAASVKDPNDTVMVSYDNPFSKQNDLTAFYTADLENTSIANTNLRIVGGYFPSNYTPLYTLVDSSLLSADPLTVGQTSNFWFTADYTNESSAMTAQLYAIPVGTNPTYTNGSEAQAWFQTSNAKASLLILESFYFKP